MLAIFLGSLDRRKGFDLLYDAWKVVCNDPAWNTVLLVVGTGAELPRWRKRARQDRLEQQIHFMGFREDVSDILKAGDLLVSPVRYEPYGLNVHEAVCCGLPSIVSSAAGIAERYPEKLNDFLLKEPENPEMLLTALHFWRTHVETAQEWFRPFSENLRSRSWDDMADEIVELMSRGPRNRKA